MGRLERQRWQSVTARDRRVDGSFVYAVRSTGVYCRPSCPSRRPDRSRVEFFDSPADAEKLGYRACKRCRPADAHADPWIGRIERARILIEHAAGPLSLDTLALQLGGSAFQLQKQFKRLIGVTPREYADAKRLARVKRRLRTDRNVTDAMLEAGYGSSRGFYEHAAARLGMTPSAYKKGAAGLRIRFTVADCALGRLLVAATDRGVCFVAMGGHDTELRRALTVEYPAAAIEKDRGGLSAWTALVLERLRGRTPRAELPVDVRATAFQWQVWKALADIPLGETRTYSELAAAVGRPRAARAVARACATNPVAIAIPCHRVVPSAGGHGGYRWGADRKARLLALEQDRVSRGKVGKMRV